MSDKEKDDYDKMQEVYDIYEEVYRQQNEEYNSDENVNNSFQYDKYLVAFDTSLRNIENYQYRERLWVMPIVIFNGIAILLAIIAISLFVFDFGSIDGEKRWFYLLYGGLPISIIITVCNIVRLKKFPKFFQTIRFKNIALISSYERKKLHSFSDGILFVDTNKNRCHKIGENTFNKYTKHLSLNNILYEKNTKCKQIYNGHKIICKRSNNPYKIIVRTNKTYTPISIQFVDTDGEGSRVSIFTIRQNLLNSKFYLPTPLKAYLEKKGVDYLNDSRIEFVDDIYKILRQSKEDKKSKKKSNEA